MGAAITTGLGYDLIQGDAKISLDKAVAVSSCLVVNNLLTTVVAWGVSFWLATCDGGYSDVGSRLLFCLLIVFETSIVPQVLC